MNVALEYVRRCYRDPETMRTRLGRLHTLADRLREALYCLDVAEHPDGRFGLTGADTRRVAEYLRGEVRQLRLDASPVRSAVLALRALGLTWDECMAQLDVPALGFDDHVSTLLLNDAEVSR